MILFVLYINSIINILFLFFCFLVNFVILYILYIYIYIYIRISTIRHTEHDSSFEHPEHVHSSEHSEHVQAERLLRAEGVVAWPSAFGVFERMNVFWVFE